MNEKAIARFWSKVSKHDDCWIWTGSITNSGYGRFQLYGKTYRANRMSWTLTNGEIPDGWFVCHHCDNPRCVRPDHLFLGNNSINQIDSARKGRHPETKKTHCPKGHPYSTENTFGKRTKKGSLTRQCKACNVRRTREWRIMNPEKYAAQLRSLTKKK